MLGRLRSLLELIRFSHTVFALPFSLSSAAIAWQERPFDPLDLLGILLCMLFARSAAMAFNRLADRRLDSTNPRTAGRHLPAGLLSPAAVTVFTLICSAGFVGSTLLFIHTSDNWWPLWLSGPVLVFICAYSFTKRFTSLAHFWLGASLFLAPVSAWIALRGPVEMATPIVLGLAVMFWVAGFDILYACQDIEHDRQSKLKSVPATLGIAHSLRVAMICHALMVCLLIGLFWAAKPHLGMIYLTGVGLVGLLIGYEHSLVRPDDLSRVNKAFFQVNAVVSIGLFLVVIAQLVVNQM
jgi:4-hydroxybenzoate polyprenyltransferase